MTQNHTPTPWEKYKAAWSTKTLNQVQKEEQSMRKFMQRHSSAYAWHGSDMTPPNTLADGDKLSCLREILSEKTNV